MKATAQQTKTEKIVKFFAELDKQIDINDNIINYIIFNIFILVFMLIYNHSK